MFDVNAIVSRAQPKRSDIMKRVLLLAAGLLLAQSALAEAPVLRIATDGTFPPYSTVNPDGSLAGFDVDIANAVVRRDEGDMRVEAI